MYNIHWLLGSIITGNNSITLHVKYEEIILHHDDFYGKVSGKINVLHILYEAKGWNVGISTPTCSPLLSLTFFASLAALILVSVLHSSTVIVFTYHFQNTSAFKLDRQSCL